MGLGGNKMEISVYCKDLPPFTPHTITNYLSIRSKTPYSPYSKTKKSLKSSYNPEK